MQPLRWAILGTGKIANRFAFALKNIPENAELLAVGSRNRDTAETSQQCALQRQPRFWLETLLTSMALQALALRPYPKS